MLKFYIFWSFSIIAWQVGWALILLAVTIGLIAILIYYFVFVFSTAVYSRVVIESPDTDGNIIISKLTSIYKTLSNLLLRFWDVISIQLIVIKRYGLARNNRMPSTGNLYKIKMKSLNIIKCRSQHTKEKTKILYLTL